MRSKTTGAHLILAGDVGGTNTRLGLFSTGGKRCRLLHEEVLPSKHYSRLEEGGRDFLERHGIPREEGSIASACFGVAGPVIGRIIRVTNLPWIINAASVRRELGIGRVELINDLVANVYLL